MSKRILKTSFFIALVALNTLIAYAQKLPGTQEKSLTLPSTVKINGTADEWNNQFQAFNKSTDVYYTMANDKDNLYLAVQATDQTIIKKIIGGGITFTLCPSGEKADPNSLSVTFPVIAPSLQSGVNVSLNELTASRNGDSVLNVLNKKAAAVEKEITVKGFKDFNDSSLSIYNDRGIKAAAQFNNKSAFTYELMIPLKLTGIANGKQIAYNIRINSIAAIQPRPVTGDHSGVLVATIPRSLSASRADFGVLQNDTDFWGKYLITN